MTNDPPVFERLCTLLSAANARFRVIEHPAAGRSEEVAAIRGTDPRQGAKAMLCTFKSQPERFVLTVLPGTAKLDFRKVGTAFGLGKATLVAADIATQLTGCVVGAIPPFVFTEQIALVAEPALAQTWPEIAFNAGRLDRSIVLASADYVRIAQPKLASITQET